MKKIYLLASLAFMINAFAQNANVALSNLNNNNGYSGYNTSTTVIEGIFFEVLSNGTNSTYVLSNFQVSLYLLPCDANGTATGSTPTIIQTITVTGMNQLSAITYSNDSVNLSQVSGLANGMYRMGVWVNSEYGIPNPPDDPSDNAGLIQSNAGTDVGSIINYTSAAGIEKFAGINEQVSVYPNPATTNFQVSLKGNNSQASITIYDVNGKLVLNQPINSKTTIDAGNFNEGVYTINIISKEGTANKKLVIVR